MEASTYEPEPNGDGEEEPDEPGTMPEDAPEVTAPEPATLPEEPDVTAPDPEEA